MGLYRRHYRHDLRPVGRKRKNFKLLLWLYPNRHHDGFGIPGRINWGNGRERLLFRDTILGHQ